MKLRFQRIQSLNAVQGFFPVSGHAANPIVSFPITVQSDVQIQIQLGMGTQRTTVALQILQQQEFDTITVQNAYQLYLHRAADSFGLTTFVAQPHQVETALP